MRSKGEAELAPVPVFAAGEIFMDVIFAGLDAPIENGTESFAREMHLAPGGIANVAFALSRLGANCVLMADLGTDAFGSWLQEVLRAEDAIDLSLARLVSESSVTTSISSGLDRAMVTYSNPSVEELKIPPLRGGVVILDLGSQLAKGGWWREAAANGSQVYADVRWEGTEQWRARTLEDLRHCFAFTPNAKEALFLTGVESVEDAAAILATRVDLVVVTADGRGSFVHDSRTDERFWSPAFEVAAKDATGAGDVFLAALTIADQSGLAIQNSVIFASICASLSVTKLSGSLGAPKIEEVLDWLALKSEEISVGNTSEVAPRELEFLSGFARSLASKRPSTTLTESSPKTGAKFD